LAAERITEVRVSAYTVPTDFPESDGTLEWIATTVVLVEIWCGTTRGLGFTYGDLSTAGIVNHVLSPLVLGHDPMAISSAWVKQLRAVRNFMRPGIASLAIAAVDSALWDLKARLLGIPLVSLLGRVRDAIPVYGSGGFTSYSTEQVQAQFREWAAIGVKKMKMKSAEILIRTSRESKPRAMQSVLIWSCLSMRTELIRGNKPSNLPSASRLTVHSQCATFRVV